MKCENCGFITNPGDQKCIKCGARINPMNVVMPGVEVIENGTKSKKLNNKMLIFAIAGIFLLAIVVFIVIKFLLKR